MPDLPKPEPHEIVSCSRSALYREQSAAAERQRSEDETITPKSLYEQAAAEARQRSQDMSIEVTWKSERELDPSVEKSNLEERQRAETLGWTFGSGDDPPKPAPDKPSE